MPQVDLEALRNFTIAAFEAMGTTRENAIITTDVLIASDRRGIASHGVARLARYINGIKAGSIDPKAEPTVIKETPTTLLVDGNAGLGQVISVKTMSKIIDKAKQMGMAAAVIRNSNHYGIAGYCAMMALKHDLIGVSSTNSAPLVVPTFGKDAVLGTNPIAVAVPTEKERPFVLDMATSTVPRGKLEVYNRLGKPIPTSWATDETGAPTTDPGRVLKNLLERKGGGLLPLGGAGEENSGYKGYGLAALVDIITGGLGLASMGLEVYKNQKGPGPDVSHFLMAIDPAAFSGDIKAFKRRMDHYLRMLKSAPKQEGQSRIWVAGEKESQAEEAHRKSVELDQPTVDKLREIAGELGLEIPF